MGEAKRRKLRSAESITTAPLPSAEVLIREFAERHAIELTELIESETIAIRAIFIANVLINKGYAELDDSSLADPAVGLLLNMLHRNFEHAEAAIVAFVTGCGASAEVVARAALESSVNIRYIFAGDRLQRLFAYFEHYFGEVDQQIDRWRAQTRDLMPLEADIHAKHIERRRAANGGLRKLLSPLMGHLEERWPKTIAERFKAIGEGISYRTVYSRMSSESHADAEETLRYFLGRSVGRLQHGAGLFEKMGQETIWMTRLYFHYAACFFLRASMAYAKSYSLGVTTNTRLGRELADLEHELLKITAHIGAG